MGHANLTNLSEVFVRQLYAKGTVTIKDVADFAIAKGETLHASEGEYPERYMICHGLEDIVAFLRDPHVRAKGEKATPVIETVEMTAEQTQIYNEWIDADEERDVGDWDCGDDGEGGEYGIFDSIKWRFAPGWRKEYPDIPILGNVTH